MLAPCSYVGCEVLTALDIKSYIFWDTMPCSTLKINRHFRITFRLHLQGRRISQAIYRHEAGSKQSLTFNELHGVISQKIEPSME
jgi:hypothetical protein